MAVVSIRHHSFCQAMFVLSSYVSVAMVVVGLSLSQLADSLDSSRCKEGIVTGIVLGTREDQIFPVAGTEQDTEAGVQQALALHGDALRFLRA